MSRTTITPAERLAILAEDRRVKKLLDDSDPKLRHSPSVLDDWEKYLGKSSKRTGRADYDLDIGQGRASYTVSRRDLFE